MEWTNLENGVWRALIGTPEDFHPIGIANQQPLSEALSALGECAFPRVMEQVQIDWQPGKLILSYPIFEDERFYGFGLQFFKVNHRGRTRYLHVNSDPAQDTGESHAPVPFFISTQGYGLFVNTARAVTVYCGSSVRKGTPNHPKAMNPLEDEQFTYTPLSDILEILIPARGVELYVFSGSSLREIVQRYNLFFGGGSLPPRWGLGFWHRTPYQANDQAVLDEAREYRERGFPCDVIGLEPGWQSGFYPCTYEFSPNRFPNPSGFIAKLESQGFRVNLWEHGFVSPKASIYPALESLSGSHTVWAGLAPDYSLPEVQGILKQQHRQAHIDIGVSGYKLDECDGSELTSFSWMFPPHAVFPSGRDGEQMRQMLGLLLQKMTSEAFYEVNRRTWGLVRASAGAATSLPYVLYSDLYDHRQFIRGLINSSFSGLLWTPEVRGAQDAADWARRFQTVCFSPLAMINAWAEGTKPWSYPEVEGCVKKYVRMRMQLLLYFYSAFARYRFEGLPPFRAMHFEDGYDPRTVAEAYQQITGFRRVRPWDLPRDEMDDQYLAGDSLLVAPLFGQETERLVYLPDGRWFDFETGQPFEGGGFHRVEASIDQLPLFVRDGGIIPMIPSFDHVPANFTGIPIEVRVYGSKPNVFRLYDDDGLTYDYQQGQHRWIRLETRQDKGRLIGSASLEESPESSLTFEGIDLSNIQWRFMN